MRNIFNLTVALIGLSCFFVSTTSCSSDEDETLVIAGTWEGTTNSIPISVEVKDDKTFILTVTLGTEDLKFSGKVEENGENKFNFIIENVTEVPSLLESVFTVEVQALYKKSYPFEYDASANNLTGEIPSTTNPLGTDSITLTKK